VKLATEARTGRPLWPFEGLRPLQYRVIVADPPWSYQLYSGNGAEKSADEHYSCMEIEDIGALPVSHLAAGNCALVLWATWPLLPEALRVMGGWGFRYRTGGAWHKKTKTGTKTAFGTGYILRSASEPFLLGVLGEPKTLSRSERNLIEAPTREHSRKPDELFHMLERLFPGPRLELFARQRRPGWDAWGNEVDRFTPTLVAAE
jgi:N6-adenosine-specific RNA methylase IME4